MHYLEATQSMQGTLWNEVNKGVTHSAASVGWASSMPERFPAFLPSLSSTLPICPNQLDKIKPPSPLPELLCLPHVSLLLSQLTHKPSPSPLHCPIPQQSPWALLLSGTAESCRSLPQCFCFPGSSISAWFLVHRGQRNFLFCSSSVTGSIGLLAWLCIPCWLPLSLLMLELLSLFPRIFSLHTRLLHTSHSSHLPLHFLTPTHLGQCLRTPSCTGGICALLCRNHTQVSDPKELQLGLCWRERSSPTCLPFSFITFLCSQGPGYQNLCLPLKSQKLSHVMFRSCCSADAHRNAMSLSLWPLS